MDYYESYYESVKKYTNSEENPPQCKYMTSYYCLDEGADCPIRVKMGYLYVCKFAVYKSVISRARKKVEDERNKYITSDSLLDKRRRRVLEIVNGSAQPGTRVEIELCATGERRWLEIKDN